jgi:Mg2+-importing ATPase
MGELTRVPHWLRACLEVASCSPARHNARGLTRQEVARRLAECGPNDALARGRRPLWRQTLDRLANPLILILLFASGLSAWTCEVTSFVIIVVIILLSVVLDVAGPR